MDAFHNGRLRSLAAAFERRGKSLRYHGSLELIRETCDEGESLAVRHFHSLGGSLSLWAGASGDWSVVAAKHRPGRAGGNFYRLELFGRFDGHSDEQVVRAFERSVSHTSERDRRRAELIELWQPIDVHG